MPKQSGCARPTREAWNAPLDFAALSDFADIEYGAVRKAEFDKAISVIVNAGLD